MVSTVLLIFLSQWHIILSFSFHPGSGGVYDLGAIADALRNDDKVPSYVGMYDVNLPDGSLFYLDPTDTTKNANVIKFAVKIRNWKNDVMLDGENLFLCRPFDATYDSCPLVSTTGITSQDTDKFSEDYIDIRTWTFSLNLSFIHQYVFVNEAAQTRQTLKTLIVSGRLNPLYHEHLANNKNLLRRPLPIVPIHIHNKYVMNVYGDERNLQVCESKPTSYVKLEPDHLICNDKRIMENAKTSPGQLLVYTPNDHGIPTIGTTCYIETHTLHESCSGFFGSTSYWTGIHRHAVSYETCKLWHKTKRCTTNGLRLGQIDLRKGVYRAHLGTWVESFHSKTCFRTYSRMKHYSDCVMDMNSQITYQFPFTHIESAVGSIPLSEFSKQNYWISENQTEILIWNNTNYQIDMTMCPFTLLKVISTQAIQRDNLHMSHALRLGIDASVRSTTVFLGDTIENSYQVNNKQMIEADNLKKLNMGKCADVNNICDTYLTDDNILLQFCPNSFEKHSYAPSSNIHYKSPLPPVFSGSGVHVIPTNTSAFLFPLEDVVCHGHHDVYTDKLSHQWKCRNGFPTLVSPIVYSTPTKSRMNRQKSESTHNATFKYPTPSIIHKQNKKTDASVPWILNQLQQLVDKECETRSILQKIAQQVSLLTPALARQFIYTHNPVHLSKSGHHYGVHRCQTINWRNVEMMPSLHTNHPSIRDFNIDAREGLCYSHPVIKIVSAHHPLMVGQLMPNNRVSYSLMHVGKCQNDRKKLFTLGDTLYVFSENNHLEDTQPAHHHTVAQQLLSKYNKLNRYSTTLPKTSDIVYTLKPEIASSAKNKVFRQDSGHFSNQVSHGQSIDSDITTTVSRIDSTLARVNSIINPIYVDFSKEQEHMLQSDELLNHAKSIRATGTRVPQDTYRLDHTSWFLKELKMIKKHFQPFIDGFTAFISFCVIPIIIIMVIINWVELRAFRTGPVNAFSGAAIGQIDKMSTLSVYDKIHKNKAMFIPRGTDNNGFDNDESIMPKLRQK